MPPTKSIATLPATADDHDMHELAPHVSGVGRVRGPMNVLLADDDATTRSYLAALVRALGHQVTTAADGKEAWAVFEAEEPSLVIADWLMPGMDGLELSRRIRDRVGDRTFIILVTSRDGTEDLQLALAAGTDDYLTKPVSAEQFRARVAIAERRLAVDRERRLAQDEAARMRWLAGIGQTVLTLQHEINNPLTALYGCLETISTSRDLSPAMRSEANAALQQAERVAGVVRRLASIRDHSTVELIPGFPMLSLSGAPAGDER